MVQLKRLNLQRELVPYAGIIRIRFSGCDLRHRIPEGTVNHPGIGLINIPRQNRGICCLYKAKPFQNTGF
jgi:hypothetical protein